MKNENKLTNNGTAFNLSAEDILNLSTEKIIELGKKRIENIGRGNR